MNKINSSELIVLTILFQTHPTVVQCERVDAEMLKSLMKDTAFSNKVINTMNIKMIDVVRMHDILHDSETYDKLVTSVNVVKSENIIYYGYHNKPTKENTVLF